MKERLRCLQCHKVFERDLRAQHTKDSPYCDKCFWMPFDDDVAKRARYRMRKKEAR